MSFDLYFYAERHVSDVFESLQGFLSSEKSFSVNKEAHQAWYRNPATGAYFSLDYEDPSENPDEHPETIGDCSYLGLSFNLNYNRPYFFALEAFPWVERIAREFGYLVLDPQGPATSTPGSPEPCVEDELVASWEKNNTSAVHALYENEGDQVTYRYLPREKALFWWEYTKVEDHLQTSLGEQIYVPTLTVLQKSSQVRLLTAVVWPDAIPEVLPPCDLLIRMVSHRNWRGKEVTLSQVIPYDEALGRLGSLAQPLFAGPSGLKVLSPEQGPSIRSVFDGLSGPELEGYEAVASDGYVDVPLPKRLHPLMP